MHSCVLRSSGARLGSLAFAMWIVGVITACVVIGVAWGGGRDGGRGGSGGGCDTYILCSGAVGAAQLSRYALAEVGGGGGRGQWDGEARGGRHCTVPA